MPVTARLSKRFYDRFGEAVTNELVDWFNQVDATYRSDLRELNEANFARFDAKLEQRFAEFRAELKGDIASFRGEIGGFQGELAGFRVELAGFRGELAGFRGDLKTIEARLEARADRTDAHLQATLRDQMKWFIVAWVAQFAAIIGLWFRNG